MAYNWSPDNKPNQTGTHWDFAVVNLEPTPRKPASAADCRFGVTIIDGTDRYRLTVDGGGHLDVEGTFHELRRLTTQLMLAVVEAQHLPLPPQEAFGLAAKNQ